jgi:adenylate cyclase
MKELAPSWFAQVVSLSAGSASEIEQLAALKSTSQERLKHEVADFFEEATRFQPLVLFFDDLHWADESTTDLLLYLSEKLNSWRMLIIGTYRPADLAITKHPFLNVAETLQGRGIQQRLDLNFLSRDDIENYLALEFPGHRFPPHLASLIHTRTEGNPLFMADLVRYLRVRRVIVEEKGQWTLSPVIPADLPESVRSMVHKKIEQLSPEDRQLLTAASVQGSQFDSAVVSKAAGLDPAFVEDRLDDLERLYAFVRLIDEQELPDGTPTLRYRFVHALYQNAFYGLLKPTRRSMLSNAVAEALLSYHEDQTSPIALNLALLFETSRSFARSADFFLMAAKRAAELFAFQEAVGLARRGLDALKRLTDSPERAYRELQLQTALGGPLTAIKGFTTPEVGQTYARARELFQRAGEPTEFFPMLFGQWAFYYSTAQTATARAIAEQSLRLAQREHEPVKLLLANHLYGATLMHCGEFDTARSALEQAMQAYAPQHDRKILQITQQSSAMIVWTWAAFTLDCLGYRDQGLRRSREAVRIAEQLLHPPSLAAALFYAGIVHQLRREPGLALERANASIALSEEHGFPLFLHNARQLRGWGVAVAGDVENGKAEMKSSLMTLRAIGTEMARPFFLAMLAEVLISNNELDAALQTIEDGLECIARTGDRFHEPELHRLKAELLVKKGCVQEAEACLRTAVDVSRQQNARTFELRARVALVRLLPGDDEARALLDNLRNWFTEGLDTVDLQEANLLESRS